MSPHCDAYTQVGMIGDAPPRLENRRGQQAPSSCRMPGHTRWTARQHVWRSDPPPDPVRSARLIGIFFLGFAGPKITNGSFVHTCLDSPRVPAHGTSHRQELACTIGHSNVSLGQFMSLFIPLATQPDCSDLTPVGRRKAFGQHRAHPVGSGTVSDAHEVRALRWLRLFRLPGVSRAPKHLENARGARCM